MLKIVRRIGAGVVSGFPLIHRLSGAILGKETLADGTQVPVMPNFLSVAVEVATVGLIGMFIFGKISFDQLKELLGFLKPS